MSAMLRRQLRTITAEAARLRARIDKLDALRFSAQCPDGQTAQLLNDYRLRVESRYLRVYQEQLRLRHLLNPPPPAPTYFLVSDSFRI